MMATKSSMYSGSIFDKSSTLSSDALIDNTKAIGKHCHKKRDP